LPLGQNRLQLRTDELRDILFGNHSGDQYRVGKCEHISATVTFYNRTPQPQQTGAIITPRVDRLSESP
jgi:hypothetical protein